MSATYDDYARASALLWGSAGEFAAAEFGRLNRELFAGSVPPLSVIISLTAFGKCIGSTHPGSWLGSPRITLAPELFNGNHRTDGGPLTVRDVLAHEMVHAVLMLRGQDSSHNGKPWCELITWLSPDVAGREVSARPVRTRRIPNPARESDPSAPKTITVRLADDGCLSRTALATWPQSIREPGYYAGQDPLCVPTY